MSYPEAIKQSAALCHNTLDTIQSSSNIESLTPLKRALINDNVNLITTKINTKTAFNTTNNQINEKLTKSNKNTLNPLLIKLQSQQSYNNTTNVEILNIIQNLPKPSIISENTIPKGTIKSIDEIHKLLESNNLNDLIITQSSINQINDNLSLDNIEKFKLIKLTNNHYNVQLKKLNEMNSKWTNELSNINSFISNQIKPFNSTLKDKINKFVETEIKAEKSNIQQVQEEEEDDDDNMDIDQLPNRIAIDDSENHSDSDNNNSENENINESSNSPYEEDQNFQLNETIPPESKNDTL